MATVATQRVAALAELKVLAQTASAPALDNSTEVEPALDACQRATQWGAATPYNFGDVVVPTTLNGRAYRCIRAGTSGATEPDWPDEGLTAWRSSWLFVTDGTAEWEDDGALKQVFDVRAAAVRCVQMKMGKVGASAVSSSANSWEADGVRVTRSGDAGQNLRAPLEALLKSLQAAGVA